MTLDNSAKIGDIITALEGMQAINQKAELASVIGSPATATDNIATQITKIQDAKDVFADKIGVENTTPLQAMADGLVVGKNWASGVTDSSTDTLSFDNSAGAIRNYNYVTITGLPFKPKTVIVSRGNSTTVISDIIPLIDSYQIISMGSVSIRLTSNAFLDDTSFQLPVNSGGLQYNWIAFE